MEVDPCLVTGETSKRARHGVLDVMAMGSGDMKGLEKRLLKIMEGELAGRQAANPLSSSDSAKNAVQAPGTGEWSLPKPRGEAGSQRRLNYFHR